MQGMSPQQQAQFKQMMQVNQTLNAKYKARSKNGTAPAGLSDAEAQQMGSQIQSLIRGGQVPQPAPSDSQIQVQP